MIDCAVFHFYRLDQKMALISNRLLHHLKQNGFHIEAWVAI
jgi:hypothetical protein